MASADYLNNPVASDLEEFADTFEELKNLEASYQKYYASALVAPFYEGAHFWPEARAVFASYQKQIDALRLRLRMPLLWFTEEEMKQMTTGLSKFPEEPREPYKMPTQPEEEEEEEEEVPDTVTVGGRTTITLDALIKQLQALRDTLGGAAPVWHVEFGGVTETGGAEEWEGGVVIE